MRDPQRLWDRKGESGRELLRSARGDSPSEAARKRTAIALGLAVGATAGTVVTAAATVPASKLGAYGGILAFVKWIGLGALGGAVAFVAVDHVSRRSTSKATASSTYLVASPGADDSSPRSWMGVLSSSPATSAKAVPQEADVAPVVPAPSASVGAPASPLAVKNEASPAPGASPTPERAPPASRSLAAEVRSLDRAAAALAAGDTNAAQAALDAHDREFADGALREEAAVLRIETLSASRDGAGAEARARAFLASFPDSAQAAHVRSLLAAIESETKP